MFEGDDGVHPPAPKVWRVRVFIPLPHGVVGHLTFCWVPMVIVPVLVGIQEYHLYANTVQFISLKPRQAHFQIRKHSSGKRINERNIIKRDRNKCLMEVSKWLNHHSHTHHCLSHASGQSNGISDLPTAPLKADIDGSTSCRFVACNSNEYG